MKHLLITYHSKEGSTGRMCERVQKGARHPDIDIEVRVRLVGETMAKDMLWADGIIFGTPENFGYMSGAMKDLFDRTFYPLEGQLEGMPIAIFISAGNDGTGALTSIRRIGNGYGFKEVQEPLIAVGELTDEILDDCETLGMYLAAGLEGGIF